MESSIFTKRADSTEFLKVTLDIYTELKRELNGSCGTACPNNICLKTSEYRRARMMRKRWKPWAQNMRSEFRLLFCCLDRDNFNFLSSKYDPDERACPCNRKTNTDEIMLRLDEFIEEVREKLTKRYN